VSALRIDTSPNKESKDDLVPFPGELLQYTTNPPHRYLLVRLKKSTKWRSQVVYQILYDTLSKILRLLIGLSERLTYQPYRIKAVEYMFIEM